MKHLEGKRPKYLPRDLLDAQGKAKNDGHEIFKKQRLRLGTRLAPGSEREEHDGMEQLAGGHLCFPVHRVLGQINHARKQII